MAALSSGLNIIWNRERFLEEHQIVFDHPLPQNDDKENPARTIQIPSQLVEFLQQQFGRVTGRPPTIACPQGSGACRRVPLLWHACGNINVQASLP